MIDITETPQWGSFALVSYIPDPLGSFLHGLRQTLPGEGNPQPHITILPPRPLKLAAEAASQQAQNILLQFPAFEVELSKVRSFPGTNMLYLDVSEGNSALHDLHTLLNAGDLDHSENFDFRPHLTLGGPVPSQDLLSVQRRIEAAWLSSDCPRRFTLDEVVFLWLNSQIAQREWQRLWSHRLSTKETIHARAARAGVTART